MNIFTFLELAQVLKNFKSLSALQDLLYFILLGLVNIPVSNLSPILNTYAHTHTYIQTTVPCMLFYDSLLLLPFHSLPCVSPKTLSQQTWYLPLHGDEYFHVCQTVFLTKYAPGFPLPISSSQAAFGVFIFGFSFGGYQADYSSSAFEHFLFIVLL